MASDSRSLEEDVFKVLKQRGIHLKVHVESALRFTGNSHARPLAELDYSVNGLKEIEQCVSRNLGKPSRYDTMSKQEKIDTFGEFFAEEPLDFIFFLGNAFLFVKQSRWLKH